MWRTEVPKGRKGRLRREMDEEKGKGMREGEAGGRRRRRKGMGGEAAGKGCKEGHPVQKTMGDVLPSLSVGGFENTKAVIPNQGSIEEFQGP